MNTINKFFLRDVRCFDGEHEFNIRPLTFLIGENSTGKSTVLGCLQAVGNLFNYRGVSESEIDFNFDPYQMGAFADIVRRSNPKKEDFELGIEHVYGGKRVRYFLTLVERGRGSEPIIDHTRWAFDEGEIIFFMNESNQGQNQEDEIRVVYGKKENEFHVSGNRYWFRGHWLTLDSLYYFLCDSSEDLDEAAESLLQFINRIFSMEQETKESRARRFRVSRGRRVRLGRTFRFSLPEIYSIAPIRSKPKRTYNPLKETATSDGSEIPMVLMNLSTSSEDEWETLRKQLLKFGHASGLFTDIALRKLGRSKNDPFQLKIKVRGPSTNLMDVGYGVSQVLPILVRIFTEQDAKFLLQQPEVHLHPKGQAELASLLVEMNKQNENSFVIETHSDYMIDRVRIEILNGKIHPEDVSLIYLEAVGNRVKTHNICFDAQANMINVPDGYRTFFLNESDKLLGHD